jgi:hypothetical protein
MSQYAAEWMEGPSAGLAGAIEESPWPSRVTVGGGRGERRSLLPTME